MNSTKCLWKCRRVLALSPHTDDVEFGAGGLLLRALEAGAEVRSVALSNAWQSLPAGFDKDTLLKEFTAAHATLGVPDSMLTVLDFPVRDFFSRRQQILEELVRMGREFEPDLVLVPSTRDVHQDHGVVTAEATRAFKQTSILGYELPWNTLQFNSTMLITLEHRLVKLKIEALMHYHSQKGRPYHCPEFLEGWMRGRGVTVGAAFAEAFEVIRWVIR